MRIRRVNTYKAFRKVLGMWKVLREYLLNTKLKNTERAVVLGDFGTKAEKKKYVALNSISKTILRLLTFLILVYPLT